MTAETTLQFGTGKFLRAFADLIVQQADDAGGDVGRVVAVQSTGADRAAALNDRGCRYHVALRGYADGKVVDEVHAVNSVARVLVADRQWDEVLAVARSPELVRILSNVTEAGYEVPDEDRRPGSGVPRSFPAKLLAALRARFEAGRPGVTVLPCELFEHNAARLLTIVRSLAADRGLADADFLRYLTEECGWHNTLVDRIVVGTPAEHPLLADDPLLLFAEPYALWAVEDPPHAGRGHPAGLFDHPNVLRAPDITPHHLRKVRILNGTHTAMVAKALPLGFSTVREVVEHPELGRWVEELLFGEIVPAVATLADGAEAFARQTLDRFRNPFIEHKLRDIALHHAAKVQLRLVPTATTFRERFGREPAKLNEVIAAAIPSV